MDPQEKYIVKQPKIGEGDSGSVGRKEQTELKIKETARTRRQKRRQRCRKKTGSVEIQAGEKRNC